MPKAKKAKTAHQNGRDDRLLTDAEIWDDSALIRSWDEAVKEYEFYHSIHARGEDVEEVLRRAEEGEDEYGDADVDVELEPSARYGSSSSQKRRTPVIFGPSIVLRRDEEDSDLDEGEIAEEAVQSRGTDENMKAKSSNLEPVQPPFQPPSTTNASPSASLLGGTGPAPSDPNSDPTLENLKMAYWWAGYYSGLYEGQRQAALP